MLDAGRARRTWTHARGAPGRREYFNRLYGAGQGYFLAAGFLSELAGLAGAAPFWGPLAPGDLFPYQDEYSKELRNSFSSPQTLQRPLLTAPFGGSMTQW